MSNTFHIFIHAHVQIHYSSLSHLTFYLFSFYHMLICAHQYEIDFGIWLHFWLLARCLHVCLQRGNRNMHMQMFYGISKNQRTPKFRKQSIAYRPLDIVCVLPVHFSRYFSFFLLLLCFSLCAMETCRCCELWYCVFLSLFALWFVEHIFRFIVGKWPNDRSEEKRREKEQCGFRLILY